MSETTVRKGVFELEGGEDPLPGGRVRREGGGRKSAEELDPLLVPALLALVEPDERGDPMSPLRWTTKSLRSLAGELTRQGRAASAPTVGRLLRENGFSGAPQGGVASPILSNIYLDRFDQFVEQQLIPDYDRGRRRRTYPAYENVENRIARAKRHGDREAVRALRRERRTLPSQDPNDPEYRRLRSVLPSRPGCFPLELLRWVMETSMLKTLAGKHKSTVTKMARRYKAAVDTPDGRRTCFQVTVQRDKDRKPLVARFGGIPLKRRRTAVITDRQPVMATARRNELIHRLLAGQCEMCEGRDGLQVHHVRKLADLNKPGRPERPPWGAPDGHA